jgi:hypothetical protein
VLSCADAVAQKIATPWVFTLVLVPSMPSLSVARLMLSFSFRPLKLKFIHSNSKVNQINEATKSYKIRP